VRWLKGGRSLLLVDGATKIALVFNKWIMGELSLSLCFEASTTFRDKGRWVQWNCFASSLIKNGSSWWEAWWYLIFWELVTLDSCIAVRIWWSCDETRSPHPWHICFIAKQVCQLNGCVRHTNARLILIRWKDSPVRKLVDCHSAINAHVLRERLRRHDLWFLSVTCKGY